MTKKNLIFRYTTFAIIATVVNLMVQRIVLTNDYSDLQLTIAIARGSIAGLIVKYALDKYWIFADFSRGLPHAGKQFALYVFTGVFTTAIFWGSELMSWLLWGTEFARECGAVVGLAIGYLYKYRLDRKYVFTHV